MTSSSHKPDTEKKHTCITDPFSKDCQRCVYWIKSPYPYPFWNYRIRDEVNEQLQQSNV